MSQGKRNPRKLSPEERRENALRPCPYLGYDRDSLGVYLLSREAYEIAESQFRRAIWLNPFEPRFKAHLAWCLYKQGRQCEAMARLTEITSDRKDEEIERIVCLIRQNAAETKTESRQ
jgi:tetratricopeptide (TPR) repeat protein